MDTSQIFLRPPFEQPAYCQSGCRTLPEWLAINNENSRIFSGIVIVTHIGFVGTVKEIVDNIIIALYPKEPAAYSSDFYSIYYEIRAILSKKIPTKSLNRVSA